MENAGTIRVEGASSSRHGADWAACPQPQFPWASPPGETLREEMDVTGRTVSELADASGMTVVTIEGILDERVALTPDTAGRLSRATGPSAQFWLNLQHFTNVANAEQSAAD